MYEVEKWGRVLEAHPEVKEKKDKMERAWAESQQTICQGAWTTMAQFIPPEPLTKSEMVAASLDLKVAERISSKAALRLIRMHPDDIERIHAADLAHKVGVVVFRQNERNRPP